MTMAATRDFSDAIERERAATTFDRNVVVTAGAGTGKTRLLVDRLVHLLMRDDGIKLTEIVALTFTNKAADEMKLRLRERLESLVAARLEREPLGAAEEEAQREVRSLIERYRLSKKQLDRRAREALRQIERSEIGTIHGFAATLLRLYPMETGVDPQFVEDDGARFERLFDELWRLWLDEELSHQGGRQEDWKGVLRKIGLAEIRSLASSFCSESVDLRQLSASAKRKTIPPAIVEWLRELEAAAADLLKKHPEARSNEKLVRAAGAILQKFLRSGDRGDCEILEAERDEIAGAINRSLKGWPAEEIERAQHILRAARALCRVDESLGRRLSDLLVPFAEKFREEFARQGWVSFDGLLARARALVRDFPPVRESLKRRFKAILIDEFQDTDPIQYEILVYLAEEIGRQAADWREVRLVPGKIFVVGDPKQSIYAFRRADIEAYLGVVEKIIKAQNGIECRLVTNFRSHGKILDVVNAVFGRLIRAREGLQPGYVAIEPRPSSDEERGPSALPFRKVTLRKVHGAGKLDSETARSLEAESLARWLEEEVLGKAEIADRDGKTVLVRPKHVAILLRKLTDVHHYLEPLRRRGLRYVVEGERHFYAAQEIIDAVNLLRAIENPNDKLALVGVLRSPLGGLADAEIYRLERERLLDYRLGENSQQSEKNRLSTVTELYGLLSRLRRETRTLPVGEAIGYIFDRAPVRLLAACSFHGEQAVANLEKLRRQAELMGREGLSTFKEVIAGLESSVLDTKEEAESALAEENLDAIRILSIHKSKGLEFPVVVLAGCHTAPKANAVGESAAALSDWSTNLVGIRTASHWDLAGLYIAEKARRREEEEQKRLLYVAMTRAREHLTISCAPTERSLGGSLLALLQQSLGEEIAAADASRPIAAGGGTIELQVAQENPAPPGKARTEKKAEPLDVDCRSYARLWRQRAEEHEAAGRTPLFLTPTLLKRREAELAEGFFQRKKVAVSPDLSLLIGELAHRFLQGWDFGADAEEFRLTLGPFLERWGDRQGEDRSRIRRELEEILSVFFASPAYHEIRRGRILGREVPLLVPWQDGIMEGVIDLLYENDGRLFLADYKTDRVEKEHLAEAASRYHHQVEIYSEAARRALEREVAGFKLIFLRLGLALDLPAIST